MPPSVAPQQEEARGGHGRHTRFPRRPRSHVITEEQLPRRAPEDELAALGRERILSDIDDAVEKDGQKGKTRAKWIFGGVAFAVVVAAIVDLSCHDNIRGWLGDAFDWIEDNPEAGEKTYICQIKGGCRCCASMLYLLLRRCCVYLQISPSSRPQNGEPNSSCASLGILNSRWTRYNSSSRAS